MQHNLIYALVRALLLGLVEDVHVLGALDGRLGTLLDERHGVVELERRARLRCGEPVSVEGAFQPRGGSSALRVSAEVAPTARLVLYQPRVGDSAPRSSRKLFELARRALGSSAASPRLEERPGE